MSGPGYQLNTRFIPASGQPAQVLEFFRRQGLAVPAGYPCGDPHALLTPVEYRALLRELAKTMPEAETAFLLGQQLLPGHLGPLSHALLQAGSLGQALDVLLRFQGWLSPLLGTHRMCLDGRTVLYWTDCCGNARLQGFVVEMTMAAVSGMCRWLGGERLPWSYSFNRTRPAHVEQHAVHLGNEVRFNAYLDAMWIDGEWLSRPWPRGSALGFAAALAEAERAVGMNTRKSLLAQLYDYLGEHLRQVPSLEHCAAHFGCSPATFKRHLALHGTHFQAELDQARTHATLRLIRQHGLSNEEIADRLGFHDANNFRRSFKRWTGLTPSMLRIALRQSLAGGGH